MPKSALLLDTRRQMNDGTYPVKIKVGYGTNLYLSTKIYLRREDWDARTQLCTGRGSNAINRILGNMLGAVINRIVELMESGLYETLSVPQIREMLEHTNLTAPTVDQILLVDYIDSVMSLKSESTRASFVTIKTKLAEYCDLDKLKLSAITFSWFEGLIKKLKDDGLKSNTIGKYIKTIKAVLKYAEDDGKYVNPAYKKVSIKEESTPMRNMPIETMRRIRDTKIDGKISRYIDAFMLSFYLIGINMADLLALPKGCIINGRLQYRRAKTGRNYSIKIEPEAQAIIDKYPGKNHLLSFGEKFGSTFRCGCNDLLNSLEPGVTWYWARYSWANYAVDLDIPKDVISECLGHTHGSAITGVYIRYSLDKIDSANRKVLDYLAQG